MGIGSVQVISSRVQMLAIMSNFHRKEFHMLWDSPVELIKMGQLGGEKTYGYQACMDIYSVFQFSCVFYLLSLNVLC